MTNTEKWAVIINPQAGNKQASIEWEHISDSLTRAGFLFDAVFTEAPFHAVQLAKDFVRRSYRNFIIVGGDGTLSEVVHAIFSLPNEIYKEITLSLIPCGTGNDWARFWKISHDIDESIAILKKGKKVSVDVGTVTIITKQGFVDTRHFVNALGIGFDACVVKNTNSFRAIFGGKSWVYTLSILKVLFNYRAKRIKGTFDNGETINQKMYTMSFGNGCYTGGGIKQTPDALPNDGVFDVMMVEGLSLSKLIRGVYLLFKGKLQQHTSVRIIKTKQCTITSSNLFSVEIDGISLPDTSSASVNIIPCSLQFIIP